MKKYLLVFVLAVLMPTLLSAQVTKSQVFIQVFGTKYYLHTVQEGETLQAIANAYGVTVSQIDLQNKAIVPMFKPGVTLKIPILGENSTQGGAQSFVYHVVQKKETLYGIAHTYGVSESDIHEHNPETRSGTLKVGQTLKIPNGVAPTPDTEDREFIYHTALQNETLHSLSQKYRVEISEIVKYNPQTKNGILPGKKIRIPKNDIVIDSNTDNTEVVVDDYELAAKNRARQQSDYVPCESYNYKPGTIIKVGLALPLFLSDNASQSEAMRTSPTKVQLVKNSEKIYEFYEGVLLAVKELQQIGRSVRLYVYDTENNEATTDRIFSSSELKQMDLVIGPLYTKNVTRAARFANENQIALVSPFAQNNDLLENNPYVFQVSPSPATSIALTAEYLATLENNNVVVIHGGTQTELSIVKLYRDNLSRGYFSLRDVPTMPFKEVNYKAGGMTRVTEALDKNKNNIVIMVSTDEVLITNVINQLVTLQKTNAFGITLLGSQSWEKFNNIDVEFLQNLNFHYWNNSYINYSDENVKNFVGSFRDKFNTDPSIYGFSGYDIAKYFITQIAKHGKYFEYCIEKGSGIVGEFNFKRVGDNGGFENNVNYVLRYNSDFELEHVNK